MDKIDLLFIKPGDQKKLYGSLSAGLSAIEPPLWAALLAAYAREHGLSVSVLDAEAENLAPAEVNERVKTLAPGLVVFTVTGTNLSASTWNMCGAGAYHEELKRAIPQIKTLFWGLHPSALPERTLTEERADFVCVGEGFEAIVGLAAAIRDNSPKIAFPGIWQLRAGQVVPNGRSAIIHNLDELPSPAWDLLRMANYRAHNWHCFQDLDHRSPYGVIYTSLGCPYNCTFCALKTLFEGKPGIRYRSPKKVIEDIDVLVKDYKIKNIKVFDECFVLKEGHVSEICELIMKRGYDLNLWAYSRIDTVNERMLKQMKKAGFNWLAYGIESGTKDVRTGVAKGRFGLDDIKRAIQMTREAGIYVCANFMFGLPDDDRQTMQDTLALAKELNCEYTNFYVTMAYPGSQLYQDALKAKTPLPKTWRGYSQFSRECLPLPTKHLSAAEVLRFRDEAFIEFHSGPEYLKMMKETFGEAAVEHIKAMLGKSLERDLLK